MSLEICASCGERFEMEPEEEDDLTKDGAIYCHDCIDAIDGDEDPWEEDEENSLDLENECEEPEEEEEPGNVD